MQDSRLRDIHRFYSLLARLIEQSPRRQIGPASINDGWPDRGVYFFFEAGEHRSDGTPRVVRVGTHGLVEGSVSTLWQRLAQHRGTLSPKGGNHRGSIFRSLVGSAISAKAGQTFPTWGEKNSTDEKVRKAERPLEEAVSDFIGAMRIAWVAVPDDPGPTSLRGFIERNAIALLSNFGRAPIDPPSRDWLGQHSNRDRVRKSGLWNNRHVTEVYDPAFLDLFAALLDKRPVPSKASPPTRQKPPILVMQCAKSKRDGGWFQAKDGKALVFVADPTMAPVAPGTCPVHPDSEDEDGFAWRKRVLDYNRAHAATGANPFNLHAAGELYLNPAYGKVAHAVPAKNFYILSACWGMVRSDFLLPNYDVTFSRSQGVSPHAIRTDAREWHDFNMLDLLASEPLIYIGGSSYLETFVRLSRGYRGPRIVYHNSQQAPVLKDIEIRRFESTTKTNWHYSLARLIANGDYPYKQAETASNS